MKTAFDILKSNGLVTEREPGRVKVLHLSNYLAVINVMEEYANQYKTSTNEYAFKWIPIEQEVPETEVLCLGRQNCMIIGCINYDEANYEYFAENDNDALDTVTHWMHLPQPPVK